MHSGHAVVMQVAVHDRPAVDQSERVEELGMLEPKLGHVSMGVGTTEDNILEVACIDVMQQEDVVLKGLVIKGDHEHDLVGLA